MRLIHTKNLAVKSFGYDVPPYSILSHTWNKKEVSFQDINDVKLRVTLPGWEKVKECCAVAARDGWDWIWIDSCCIDKTNTSELSESINSMLGYYQQAEVCYAYLADVDKDASDIREDFTSSRWFTRGWTLQELLAPKFLLFLDMWWKPLGPREHWTAAITLATGIERKYLMNFRYASVSTKLSWARSRQTTKLEDRAYCLLGLLGVSMPLIYGEGKEAFRRLQRELIMISTDETIFAWSSWEATSYVDTVLASDPSQFRSGLVAQPFDKARRGYAMTNAGLSIEAELWESLTGETIIRLNVAREDAMDRPLVLQLYPIQRGTNCFRVGQDRPLKTWDDTRLYHSLGRRAILILDPDPETSYPNIEEVMHGNPAYVVRLDYHDEIHVHKMSTYRPNPLTGEIKELGPSDLQELVCGLQVDEIQLHPRHCAILEIQLQTTKKPLRFGVTIRPASRFPQYGVWLWDSPEDVEKMLHSFAKDWRRQSPFFINISSHNRVISVSMSPRPKQPFHSCSNSYISGTSGFREFSLRITSEDSSLRRRRNAISRVSPIRTVSPPLVPPKQADPPIFSNHQEQNAIDKE
ncbi:heterokaryon incompatibility protein-domain-containing protein [Hypoxylon crocopeplum]|nr:heterokaryon incompatibility protein-domain-containing protein [Hypoxylon crocopeplum]